MGHRRERIVLTRVYDTKEWWWVKSPRIHPIHRIRGNVRKQIDPPLQFDGIGGDVSAGLGVVVSEVVVMESCLLVVVLARIYSDTSPPIEACFLPPCGFSFQRAGVMKLVYLITEQKTSQAVKRKNSLFNREPWRADGSKGEFVLSLSKHNLSLAMGGRVSALA